MNISSITLCLALGIAEIACSASLRAEEYEFISWNVAEGDLGDMSNWQPETTPDLFSSSNRWEIRNAGTAVIAAGQNYGFGLDILIGSSNGSGSLVLNGDGILTVKRYLAIGQGIEGEGQVTLNDTSSLTIQAGSLLVGQRGIGSLSIAADASVVVQSGDARIGEGRSGTVNLSGTLEVPLLFFGSTDSIEPDQNSIFNFEPGAKLRVAKDIIFSHPGSHFVQINGWGGEFLGGSLRAGDGNSTFRFQTDAGGVTTIKVSGQLEVSGSNLEINLDGFSFKQRGQKLVLFECHSLSGEFAKVIWLGKTKGTVKYGNTEIYVVVDQ